MIGGVRAVDTDRAFETRASSGSALADAKSDPERPSVFGIPGALDPELRCVLCRRINPLPKVDADGSSNSPALDGEIGVTVGRATGAGGGVGGETSGGADCGPGSVGVGARYSGTEYSTGVGSGSGIEYVLAVCS